jgi:hypothetical protein
MWLSINKLISTKSSKRLVESIPTLFCIFVVFLETFVKFPFPAFHLLLSLSQKQQKISFKQNIILLYYPDIIFYDPDITFYYQILLFMS